ncbi:Frizzled-1 [Liparis tanakae]|uniref:Frizzled-1 n=1 Tax=Liparis tanakae TaxID=230148 RepID=A0A4Z2F9F9_9TELE|nr:Frizzled-1 [Liparis tanakae]
MAAGGPRRGVWIPGFALAVSLLLARPGVSRRQKSIPVPDHGFCQVITVPLCRDLAYNLTVMPNLLGHGSQDEAGLEVHQFYPLVKVQCSEDLRLFLCSVYLPVCTVLEQAPPPCRSLCERARLGCEALMIKFGFQWPERLRCENWPVQGEALCVWQKTPRPPSSQTTRAPDLQTTRAPDLQTTRAPDLQTTRAPDLQTSRPSSASEPHGLMHLGARELRLGRRCVGAAALLACGSSLFGLLTYLLDAGRFRYPERPLVFVSGCDLAVALAYGAGFLLEDEVACGGFGGGGYKVVAQGAGGAGCAALFAVLYFFGAAGSVWRVVLSLAWFLSAAMKWGPEALEANARYFHLAAWALPAAQTLAALEAGRVEGDPLTGVCYVGVRDADALRRFVLAPLLVYLLVGSSFLLAGFGSLLRIRTAVKRERGAAAAAAPAGLAVRVGLFGVLNALPAAGLAACCLYEAARRTQWDRTWRADACRHFAVPCPSGGAAPLRPGLAALTLRPLLSLSRAVTAGCWLWSGKTLHAWRRKLSRIYQE